nr:monoacylglycerol lipase ABHD6 isoform X1 [Dasypus novemcinctus]XP_058144851.1 monoacylglycerol lipase ABHD6 isoform X1 [Dasypus novemcinctus]XP_058144852.1 monoacylglycerol lipase ABHD6 isoform X1 [Dasypus novemcinctus]XP_058144854.1 monoacylglycerol lipase ABHD6 isoform X1 [Dasypus novemcinctus]
MDLDLVNMFVIAGGTLAIPILAFVASFLLWPSALIRIYYWYWRRTLGMQVRYVHHGDYQFCYSFRGRPGHKPSILMLHGFSAHKDMWLSVVKFLPKNLHLVCVDMPGHEGTTRSSMDDLSIDGQVKRIHQFVECLKLNKRPFHLVGTSMGGHVAGVYAAYYPSDICSLSLVCPAGLEYATDNQFVQQIKALQDSDTTGKIPLIPSTPEEMSEMLQLCSYVRFKVPQQVTWSWQRCASQRPKARGAGSGGKCQLPSFIPSSICSLTPCTHLFIIHPSGTKLGQVMNKIRQRRTLGTSKQIVLSLIEGMLESRGVEEAVMCSLRAGLAEGEKAKASSSRWKEVARGIDVCLQNGELAGGTQTLAGAVGLTFRHPLPELGEPVGSV